MAELTRRAGRSDEELVAAFARARDGGDRRRRLELWQELAVNQLDRVRSMVASFRFDGGGSIAADDREDAVQEAFLRVNAMAENFRGATIGEFRVAVRTAVTNACLDFGRATLRHEKRRGGSLDEPASEDGSGSRYEAAVARHSGEQEAAAREAERDEERRAEEQSLVRAAIARVDNEGYRAVLELTFVDQLSGAGIATRLGITEANVYQRRRRGLQKLEKILRDERD